MNFEETLAKRSAEAERILSAYLPKEAGYAATVLEAMRYSAMSDGQGDCRCSSQTRKGGKEWCCKRHQGSCEGYRRTYALLFDRVTKGCE